jgi:ElaA protein
MVIIWKLQFFSELNTSELYQVMALRQKVFIVEQQDVYLDLDGKDFNAIHISGYDDQQLIAYARILLPEEKKCVRFGRVIVNKEYRGTGLGKALINQIFNYLKNSTYSGYPVKISAQTYLIEFYQDFGFKIISDEYLDGTIPHVDMLKS